MKLNIFDLRPISRTTARIVTQAMSQGGLFTIKTGLRALPILFHLPDHFKLNRLMNSASLQELVRHQPRLCYKYLGNYLANSLSREARLRILLNHYEYLNQQASNSFFGALLNGLTLWEETISEEVMRIRLSFPTGIDFEGDLALTFEMNGEILYNLSFVLAPGQHVHSPLAQVLFVSRIQGGKNFDAIRHSTKTCHDITPAALLVSALQGIAAALGLNMLVGISTEERLYDTIKFDYNAFWESFGANRTKEDLYALALPVVKTPIELIKGKRRERTMRKRNFKDQISAAVQQAFGQHLIYPQLVPQPVEVREAELVLR